MSAVCCGESAVVVCGKLLVFVGGVAIGVCGDQRGEGGGRGWDGDTDGNCGGDGGSDRDCDIDDNDVFGIYYDAGNGSRVVEDGDRFVMVTVNVVIVQLMLVAVTAMVIKSLDCGEGHWW